MKFILSFTLNDSTVDIVVRPTDTLLDVLREKLKVSSPKRGCDSGDCGACTVLLDQEPVRACLTLALTVADRNVQTAEGLSRKSQYHPLQNSFLEQGATQCGYCTPGMLMSAKALLNKNPDPTRKDIVEYMSGNFCRCGAYEEIIDAIQAAAHDLRGEKKH